MSRILLNRIYYPVTVLGYGRRLGVWVQGCKRACPGCISPEMQTIQGALVEVREVTDQIPKDLKLDGLTISGGEPFDQPDAVAELVLWYLNTYNDDVLIYTGYGKEELDKRSDPASKWLLAQVAALVDGSYVAELNTGQGSMGSSNQRLYVSRYMERYQGFATQTRKLQCIQETDRLYWIGIPPFEKER